MFTKMFWTGNDCTNDFEPGNITLVILYLEWLHYIASYFEPSFDYTSI